MRIKLTDGVIQEFEDKKIKSIHRENIGDDNETIIIDMVNGQGFCFDEFEIL